MKKTSSRIPQSLETRDLLLRTAGPIFAKQGFHATSVRQITKEAGVNLAAINYHFRDKQELYVQVLFHAHQAAAKMGDAGTAGTLEERLRSFIQKFLGHLLDPQRPDWHGRLIAREMAEPSFALDRLTENSIKPVGERIFAIVRDFLGPRTPEVRIRRTCFSVIGQCLYYVHCREMIGRLFPDQRGIATDIDALADHIFEFSLAGIHAVKTPRAPRQKNNERTQNEHRTLQKSFAGNQQGRRYGRFS